MKQTTMAFKKTNRKHFVIDATNKVVGRLAVEISNVLRGKDRPEFVHHQDCGDSVIVINAKDIKLTGNKWEQKMYYSHSGYPGNLKAVKAKDVHTLDKTRIIFAAVKGMLPKNKLQAVQLKRLRVFEGSEHTLNAQKPLVVEDLRNRGE